MKTSSKFVVAAAVASATLLSACVKTEPSATVESLVVNPDRLKQLREQCKADRAKQGDELCDRVAEAAKRRFFADGKVPYNPPKESPKF
ncbi:MAG: entry exclusion lipoprotein TrbK [Acidovorax sp. SCN 65-28]|uniref:EexN family lipoprotein n=1 Tax=Acidovorax sp. TaxID=1872122 RepID=UPI00086F013F|nr:EexN family lipoprotein [Acidovorax sp.]MBN9625988.1 EexN family lipoprotein [Acidovorax sp.]ODS80064.1 MAG: entry exclusion lipoprotein TrbK [Acidovorax sp. SCN 65-28]